MNALLTASAATAAFLAGFGIAMLISSAVGGSRPWSKGDKAAATLIVCVFLALIWIIALGKLAVTGWSA